MSMIMISKPERLVQIAAESYGIKLEQTEAEIILGYLEGSDFCLLSNWDCKAKCDGLYIHDNQDTDENSGDEVFKFLDVVDFCQFANCEILAEQDGLRNPPADYVSILKRDDVILQRLCERCIERGYAKGALPKATDRTYTVTEFCPNCENEIEMRWDTDDRGFKAFCPVCGKRLMLCDECQHLENRKPCNFDTDTDSCRYNPNSF